MVKGAHQQKDPCQAFIPKMADTTTVTCVYGNKVALLTLLKKNPVGIIL